MGFNLLICESPNKKATIKQYLDNNWKVEASVGHISKIKDSGLYNMGIDVKNNFDIDFIIDDKKRDVVKNLKNLVQKADNVYIASDPDREGEAIAYHLKNFLNIPAKKFKRITFHEVTKKAVLDAIDHPGKLDDNLVNAALARASLDKIVGYRLSPIARNKVSCRSVGRCQSPALKLIVEREEEITNFVPKTYYEIFLPFIKNKKEYKAQFKGLIKDKKNKPTIEDKEFAEKVVSDCKGYDYILHKIECEDRVVQSKPPFITSTFQQEVSSKLGYSVKTAMKIAQDLFTGINIKGEHKGLISYIRTDSYMMPDEIIAAACSTIENTYGKELVQKYKNKSKKSGEFSQEGHSCIYAVDLSITPEILESYIMDSKLINVYRLIYNRTLECNCRPAIISDTNFIIKNGEYKFIYTEHAIKYPGWKLIANEREDDIAIKPLDVCVGEKLNVIK